MILKVVDKKNLYTENYYKKLGKEKTKLNISNKKNLSSKNNLSKKKWIKLLFLKNAFVKMLKILKRIWNSFEKFRVSRFEFII